MNVTPIRETAGLAPAAADKPGRVLLTIITAGEGSSGKYPAETLQRAVEEKAFPRGTQGHIDHDTMEQMAERPAGSLKNLALVLEEDAWYHPGEQALKAHAIVGRRYRDIVEDYKEFIGASISAGALINEDRVVEQIVPSWRNRVDLVTIAGRGGKVDQVLEAVRAVESRAFTEAELRETTNDDKRGYLSQAVRAAHAAGEDDWAYMVDHDDTNVYFEKEGKLWAEAYTLNGVNVTLAGSPIEVRRRTEYDPVNSPADPAGVTENKKEAMEMAEISETELTQLREQAGRVAELERQLQEAQEAAAAEAVAARVAVAEGIVKEAFGEAATAYHMRTAKHAAEAEDFDAEAFKAEVQEAAAALHADGGAGNPTAGESAPVEATESKREFSATDYISALEGKN